jgi:hypothetical protein
MLFKRIEPTIQPAFDDKYITALIIILILVGAFLLQTGSASAANTSAHIPNTGYCSQPKSNGHCYATVDWYGPTVAAFTNLSPYGSMSCGGCGGFIDNEMWLSDTSSSQCVNDSSGGCWVEAGIEAISSADSYDCQSGSNATCLFWADARPGTSGGFHHHSLYAVGGDGTDLGPWYFYVYLQNYSGVESGNTWFAEVDAYEYGSLVADWTQLSTNNQMTPLDIIVGSELAANNGDASASQNDFQYNQWMDSSDNWHEQTSLASNNGTNGPPYGSWTDLPNSVDGGIWTTSD